MTTRFELPSAFIASEDIPLTSTDLRCGLARQFIKPSTAASLASREVSLGSNDPVLQQLTLLLQDETDQAEAILAEDSLGSLSGCGESLRKWLYMELKAAYLERARLNDPLGVVEQIYADFDYPTSIVPLVRYMPLPPGEEGGVDVLMDRWSEYLQREHEALARHEH